MQDPWGHLGPLYTRNRGDLASCCFRRRRQPRCCCCWCRRRFFSTRSTVAGLIISCLKVFNPSAYIFILMFFHPLSMKKLSVMESRIQVLSHELLGDGFVTLMSMYFFGVGSNCLFPFINVSSSLDPWWRSIDMLSKKMRATSTT